MNTVADFPPRTDAPAPLVPAECAMVGKDWFPFYFDRLRRSKWWRRATDMCRARNVMLWGEAYKASPAGSLPDDDDELAEAAGFGMDVDAFLSAKSEIMAPWVLCTDGRWYHPTVCEVVMDAWERTSERRKADAKRKADQRARSHGTGHSTPKVAPKTPSVTPEPVHVTADPDYLQALSDVTPPEVTRDKTTHTDRTVQTGQDRTEKTPSGQKERAPSASPPKRGNRLPEDWQPSVDDHVYAVKEGFTPAMIERIIERFRNYWHARSGNGATKLDWHKTWRNWVAEEAEKRGKAKQTQADWC